jgi:hypothetical protein
LRYLSPVLQGKIAAFGVASGNRRGRQKTPVGEMRKPHARDFLMEDGDLRG